MTKKDFQRKFATVRPGAWVSYFSGYLFGARQLDKAIDALGAAVWSLYQNGECALVQRRNGDGCEYFAVKL